MQVLIIEDDKFLCKIYATKLKKEGISVDFALNGEEGLKKVEAEKPELILLDLIMPKLDGFQVLEALQKDAKLKKITVIVLSNLGQGADIDRAKKLGAKDYIIKSDTSIEEVLKKIRNNIK